MKKYLLGMVCAVLAGSAWADGHLYGALQGGINTPGSLKGQLNFGAGVSTDAALKLNSGSQGGATIGWQTNDWRFELEGQHGSAGIKEMRAASIVGAATGSMTYDALTFNAYSYGTIRGALLGYVGAGIGWGRTKTPGQANLEGCDCFGEAKGSGLVYQWRVGLEYALHPKHALFAQYGQLYLPASTSTHAVQYDRKNIGSLGLGYRFHF